MNDSREHLLDRLEELQGRLVSQTTTARQLRAILDAVPANIIVTDMQASIREVNAFACEELGYTREELVGLHPWDIDADWTPERVGEAVSGLALHGRITTNGTQVRKDGSTFPVLVSLALIELGPDDAAIVGVSQDQTERRALDQLRAEHAEAVAHQEAFAAAHGLVHYSYAFDSQFTETGGPVGELTAGVQTDGQTSSPGEWLELIHPDDRPRFLAMLEGFAKPIPDDSYVLEYRLVPRPGVLRFVEDRARLLRGPDGQPTRAIGFLIDRTEQRELEQRFQATERLEAVGRLAGGVCHDFNNLLTGILGFSELALGQLASDHPARECIEQALAAAKQARSVTAQLLAFSALRPETPPRVVDLAVTARELEPLLGHLLGERGGLEITCTRPSPRVLIDPSDLQRIALNLVLNARDAMPGGGKVRLAIDRVSLAAPTALTSNQLDAGSYATLTVEDRGVGIPREVLTHVFEPYFTTKPHGQGSGLGLATVYGIVRQAGGAIHVESEPGDGTRMIVYLPEQAGSAEPAPQRRALVLEDDPMVRQLIVGQLVQEGWQVVTAADGPTALALTEHQEPLDLVVSDVQLPGPSGPEVVARLRAGRPNLVVLFISGYPVEGLDLPEWGSFLPKPFGLQELSAKVREVLGEVAEG